MDVCMILIATDASVPAKVGEPFWSATTCTVSFSFISEIIERELLEATPSVPKLSFNPASKYFCKGNCPEPNFKLEVGQ